MNSLGRRVKSVNYPWVRPVGSIVRNRSIEWLDESWICFENQSQPLLLRVTIRVPD